METLYKNDDESLSLSYDEQNNCFEQKLMGNISDQDYKKINKKLEWFISEKKCYKVIYNIKDLERSDIASRAWHSSVFMPKLVGKHQGGLITAVINSSHAFEEKQNTLLFNKLKMINRNGEIRFFESNDDAKDWIKKA